MGWGSWLAIAGGIIAAVGQWQIGYWLPVIGGVIAVVGGVWATME